MLRPQSSIAKIKTMDGRDAVGDAILDTEAAKCWLAQFHKDDLDTAKLLLCSLRLISSSHYDESLMRLLQRLVMKPRRPVALFATRELTKPSPFEIPRPPDPVFFDAEGRPPNLVPGENIGSEGATEFLLTRMGRANKDLLIEPTLEKMRHAKCRLIVLVDDLVGSGTRTRISSDAMYHNPTIKSWKSFGWIDGAVAAYAATEDGEQKVLHRNKLIDVVESERRPEADAHWWDNDTLRKIKSLCFRYAKRVKINKWHALGVGEMLGTLIFEHACTNVTPAILWKKTKTWEPLFPTRTIPLEMRPLFRLSKPAGRILRRLQKLGYKKLEEREKAATASPALGVDMAAFIAAASRLRTTKRIAPFLGITFSECDELARVAQQNGFLDDGARLTELGREELSRLGRAPRQTEKKLPSNEEIVYIPGQLRAT